MAKYQRRDTGPELAIRRRLHAAGLRYRVDAPLPGLPRRRADILFRPAMVAVFVDGCFWHGCPRHGTLPRTNTEWWRDKLDANRRRDQQTDEHLTGLGWLPIRFWEHDDADMSAALVLAEVRVRRAASPSTE